MLVDYGYNITVFRKHLLRIAYLESVPASPDAFAGGGDQQTLVVRLDHLKSLLTATYDIENAVVVDMFCRELSRYKDGAGFVTFVSLIELFNEFTNGDRAQSTAEACFRIFDPHGSDVLTHKALKKLRGCVESDMEPGVNTGNIKVLLDMWQHTPGIAGTVTIEDFPAMFVDSATLAESFMEEIVRQVLVMKYEHNRQQLMAAPKEKKKGSSFLPAINK